MLLEAIFLFIGILAFMLYLWALDNFEYGVSAAGGTIVILLTIVYGFLTTFEMWVVVLVAAEIGASFSVGVFHWSYWSTESTSRYTHLGQEPPSRKMSPTSRTRSRERSFDARFSELLTDTESKYPKAKTTRETTQSSTGKYEIFPSVSKGASGKRRRPRGGPTDDHAQDSLIEVALSESPKKETRERNGPSSLKRYEIFPRSRRQRDLSER